MNQVTQNIRLNLDWVAQNVQLDLGPITQMLNTHFALNFKSQKCQLSNRQTLPYTWNQNWVVKELTQPKTLAGGGGQDMLYSNTPPHTIARWTRIVDATHILLIPTLNISL